MPGIFLDISLLRPADNDSALDACEGDVMKLIHLVNSFTSPSATEEIEDNVSRNNLVLQVIKNGPSSSSWVTGQAEHIRVLRLVSGWAYDYDSLAWGSYSLVVGINAELAISVVQRAFPEIEVEVVDCAALDAERYPEQTPEEIDDEFERWFHSQ